PNSEARPCSSELAHFPSTCARDARRVERDLPQGPDALDSGWTSRSSLAPRLGTRAFLLSLGTLRRRLDLVAVLRHGTFARLTDQATTDGMFGEPEDQLFSKDRKHLFGNEVAVGIERSLDFFQNRRVNGVAHGFTWLERFFSSGVLGASRGSPEPWGAAV